MSVEWIRETSRDAEYSGEKGGEFTATRSWLAKTSSPATSPASVAGAAGVSIGDAYPDDGDLKAYRFRVRSSDSSGLLWTVTWEYKPNPGTPAEPPDPQDPEQPQEEIPGRPATWGGSSSVTAVPIYKDRNGDVIQNTAGDPLEDVTAEQAEDRLTFTQYRTEHTGWMADSRRFTNAVNSIFWNGGEPGTWKCQGCSKKVNFDKTDQGTEVYWEITWEFAWRRDGWQPKPWNIGFHELSSQDEGGVTIPDGFRRVPIKGARQPVALDENGEAKPAGEPPDVVEVLWYPEEDFGLTFGEVYTPSP